MDEQLKQVLQGKIIGFLGGGAIAEALLRGLLDKEMTTQENLLVFDTSEERLQVLEHTYGVRGSESASALTGAADILFLTVKPQVLKQIISTLALATKPTTLILSVAAGIPLDFLESHFRKHRVVRVMPNTPVAVGEGMTAFALGSRADQEADQAARAVFSAVGRVEKVDENLLDAITGLSGSGPSYAFLMIDALADAGVRVGLSRKNAILMAAQTLLGAAKMVVQTGQHPAILRDMVASPGGTSIAGLHALESHNVRAALIDAVVAATERSKEMGKGNS